MSCHRSTWRPCLQLCTACWRPKSSPFTSDQTNPGHTHPLNLLLLWHPPTSQADSLNSLLSTSCQTLTDGTESGGARPASPSSEHLTGIHLIHPFIFCEGTITLKNVYTLSVQSSAPNGPPCCYLTLITLSFYFPPSTNWFSSKTCSCRSLIPQDQACLLPTHQAATLFLWALHNAERSRRASQKCSHSSHSTVSPCCWRVDAAAPPATFNRKVFTVVL